MIALLEVDRQLTVYEVKLLALTDRQASWSRSSVGMQAERCADALVALMYEAPLNTRARINDLADRFEALRIARTT